MERPCKIKPQQLCHCQNMKPLNSWVFKHEVHFFTGRGRIPLIYAWLHTTNRSQACRLASLCNVAWFHFISQMCLPSHTFLVKEEKYVLSFPEVADMLHGAYQLLSWTPHSKCKVFLESTGVDHVSARLRGGSSSAYVLPCYNWDASDPPCT